MAQVYDNWDRLVRATLKKEELRRYGAGTPSELSLSSSSFSASASASFNLSASPRLAPLLKLHTLLVGEPFDYDQILQASNIWNRSNLIYQGGSSDLFTGVLDDGLIQLPSAQRALLSQCQQVEKALDRSVELLDICSMSKDALTIMKESLQKLESSLRRQEIGESGSDEVENFQVSKKNIKRIVKRCFKSISKMEIQGEKPEQVALLSTMREIEEHSLTVLRSILSFVFGAEEKSFLSKLISSKQTVNNGEVMEKMDRALEALKAQKTENIDLYTAESIIQELEEALECLFRQLLKSRVSLLNTLNH